MKRGVPHRMAAPSIDNPSKTPYNKIDICGPHDVPRKKKEGQM